MFLDLLSTGTFNIRLVSFLRNVTQGRRHLYRELGFKVKECRVERGGSVDSLPCRGPGFRLCHPRGAAVPGDLIPSDSAGTRHACVTHTCMQAEHSGIK